VTEQLAAHDTDAPDRPSGSVIRFGLLLGVLAMGYGVLFAMLDEFRDEYGIAEGRLGFVIGVGFLTSFVAQILIAPLADRGHARRLVVLGVAMNAVGLLLMATATTFVPLLLGRVVAGLGVGTAYPAIRRIVILRDPEHLGHNLGTLLAWDVAGFAAGPALAAVLIGPFGVSAPFLVVAGAAVLAAASVVRVRVDESVPAPGTPRLAVDLLRIRPFAGAVVLGCAVFMMIGAFDALWSLVMSDLDAAEWIANLGITLFALPLIFLGSLGGRLAQRIGPFRFATLGLVGGAGFMFLYGVLPGAGWLFAVVMVHSINDALTVSSTGVAVGMSVDPSRQAGAQGVLGGLQTLTAGMTAIWTGALYEAAGRTVAYTVCAVGMLTLVAIGVWLAGPAWRLSGARG
jgi:MFS family permease